MDQIQSAADNAQTEVVGKLRIGQTVSREQAETSPSSGLEAYQQMIGQSTPHNRTVARPFITTTTNSVDLVFSESTVFVGIEKVAGNILWKLGHNYAAKGPIDGKSVMTVVEIRYIGPATESAADAASGRPTWTVPSQWQPQEVRSPLGLAFFRVTDEPDLAAEISVSTSKPQAFGVRIVDHINRWRQQVTQPAIEEAELKSRTSQIETASGTLLVLEVSGNDARTGDSAALIGVILQQPYANYFYRIIGDPPLVAAQKEEFLRFVRSADYPKN